MAEQLIKLQDKFPCREKEINQLFQYYGHEDEPYIDALYIQGLTSTGKTSIVKNFLETFEIKHVFIDMIRCNTTKILFETLLNQISQIVNKTKTYNKCDNLMEFLHHLKYFLKDLEDQIVIVFDKAERFRKMDINLLPAFLRLQELSQLDISVIFISNLSFLKLIQKVNVNPPNNLYFRQYNREDILKILTISDKNFDDESLKLLQRTGDNFYKNYLNVLLSVFYRNCRDLVELRHQSHKNFHNYCAPVIKKEINPSDVSKLWHKIAPTLKSSLEAVYMRTNAVATNITGFNAPLPFYAKYLLIAAYLASYNPAKEDRRLFAKDHVKKRKTLAKIRAKEKVTELLNTQLGPKQFTFDRLLAIFFSILDDKVGLCANLMSQISSLVQMQLLTTIGDGVNLDGHKFKCNVDFEYIQGISKSVGFNIRKYLYDFI